MFEPSEVFVAMFEDEDSSDEEVDFRINFLLGEDIMKIFFNR